MQRGDAADIASTVAGLLADPELAKSIARRGRAFALTNLRWAGAAAIVSRFYHDCHTRRDQRAAEGPSRL